MRIVRKPYPSDVSDEEWSLVAPYLALMREDAVQRQHLLRELFNGLRYLIRYGIAWRAMPNDLPPWAAVYQQAQRWMAAGCFEAMAHDLRAVLRLAAGRNEEPPRQSSTAARCVPRRRAARGRAMTVPNASAARSCISRSTRSATCSPCT
jgi:transposase